MQRSSASRSCLPPSSSQTSSLPIPVRLSLSLLKRIRTLGALTRCLYRRTHCNPIQLQPTLRSCLHHRLLRTLRLRKPWLPRYPDWCALEPCALTREDHSAHCVQRDGVWILEHVADGGHCVSSLFSSLLFSLSFS